MSSENAKLNYKNKVAGRMPPSSQFAFYEKEEEKLKFLKNVDSNEKTEENE